jgi:hypothetical protein
MDSLKHSVQPKNLGGIHAERTVHKDRDARQSTGQRQLVQRINDLLCPTDRERRDDHFAFAFQRCAHEPRDFVIRIGLGRMFASTIRALDLQIIHVLHPLRITQNVVVAAPHVAAEQITK